MVKVLFLLSSVASLFLGALAFNAEKTRAELIRGDVIPTIFADFEPTAELKITYGSDYQVENGETIPLSILSEAPGVDFTTEISNAAGYTFLMINLDSNAPNATVQWLKTNMNAGKNDGVDISAYKSPKQTKESYTTTPQRIVYALFEQPKDVFTTAELDETYVQTDLKEFVAANNLKLINAAYIYTQQQDGEVMREKSFKQSGLLDDLLDTVDDILGININLGRKKNNGNNNSNNNNSRNNQDEDDDDSLLDLNIGGNDGTNIHIGLGGADHVPEPAAKHNSARFSRNRAALQSISAAYEQQHSASEELVAEPSPLV